MDGIEHNAGKVVQYFVITAAYVPEILIDLAEQTQLVKRVFRVFIRVGREGVDQWFVAGDNRDLAILRVVSKVLDA